MKLVPLTFQSGQQLWGIPKANGLYMGCSYIIRGRSGRLVLAQTNLMNDMQLFVS